MYCIDILGCQWEGQELYSACLLYLFYKGFRFQQKYPRLFFSGLSDNFIKFFFWWGWVGQIVKDIDSGSPAEKAGLKNNDLVVAVNGESVESLDHDSVVEMIKKGGDQTSLLVVDKETENIYKMVSNTRPHIHELRLGPFSHALKLWLSYHFDLHTGRGIKSS